MSVLARLQRQRQLLKPTTVFNRAFAFSPRARARDLAFLGNGSNNNSRTNNANANNMDLPAFVERLRSGAPPKFPADADSLQFAQKLDSQDALRHLRDEFILPTKGSLKKRALDGTIPGMSSERPWRHHISVVSMDHHYLLFHCIVSYWNANWELQVS
jgi:hypothetical protein